MTKLEQFKNDLVYELNKRLSELDEGFKLVEKTVIKNNGVEKTGIAVVKDYTENVIPTLYVEDFHKLYDGKNLDDLVDKVFDSMMQGLKEAVEIKDAYMDKFRDKDFILQHVRFDVIDSYKNKNELLNEPYKDTKFLGISARYRVVLEEAGCRNSSFVVMDSLVEELDISASELHEAALANLISEGYNINSIENVMVSMLGDDSYAQMMGFDKSVSVAPKDSMMCVLSATDITSPVRGARVILNNQALLDVYNELGEPFYILPSSIHEVLVVKKSSTNLGVEELKEMVHMVNGTVLNEEDYLSDNVYSFNGSEVVNEIGCFNGLERG